MALAIFTSDRFADHLPPAGHPERVERAEVMQVVASEFRRRGGSVLEPRPATDEELARIHDRAYLDVIRETAGRVEFGAEHGAMEVDGMVPCPECKEVVDG